MDDTRPTARPLAHARRSSRLAGACLIALMAAAPVAAQSAPQSSAPATGFLTRYEFHLDLEALSSPSPHFSWDAHFGGDLDFYSYAAGRVVILADYEPVLSDQVRFFEPVQGNYTLEGGATYRLPPGEFAIVVHHVSRHLSDQAQLIPVDWNTVGVRFDRGFAAAGGRVFTRVTAARIFRFRYVDYSWTADADLGFERAVTPKAGAFVRGSAHVFGVDRTIAGRGTQFGGRVEAGIDIGGRRGALELFAGYERRVDAEVFGRTPLRWALVGMRLVSR